MRLTAGIRSFNNKRAGDCFEDGPLEAQATEISQSVFSDKGNTKHEFSHVPRTFEFSSSNQLL